MGRLHPAPSGLPHVRGSSRGHGRCRLVARGSLNLRAQCPWLTVLPYKFYGPYLFAL